MSENKKKVGQNSSQLNIELNEATAEGEYANLAMIAHTAEEFVIDFIRVMPGVPSARVKSRIIVTPQHAKRFMRALADNIGRYEDDYGEIPDRSVPEGVVTFGGGQVGHA